MERFNPFNLEFLILHVLILTDMAPWHHRLCPEATVIQKAKLRSLLVFEKQRLCFFRFLVHRFTRLLMSAMSDAVTASPAKKKFKQSSIMDSFSKAGTDATQ